MSMNRRETQLLVESWKKYIVEEKNVSSESYRGQISKGTHILAKNMYPICKYLIDNKNKFDDMLASAKSDSHGIINKIRVNREKIQLDAESLALAALCFDYTLRNNLSDYIEAGKDIILSIITVKMKEKNIDGKNVLSSSNFSQKELSELGELYLKYNKLFLNAQLDSKKGLISIARNEVAFGTVLLYLKSDKFRDYIKGLTPKVIVDGIIEIFDSEEVTNK